MPVQQNVPTDIDPVEPVDPGHYLSYDPNFYSLVYTTHRKVTVRLRGDKRSIESILCKVKFETTA